MAQRLPTSEIRPGRSPFIGFRLGLSSHRRLKALEEATGKRQSEIIREALERHMVEIETSLKEVAKAS